MLRKNEVEERGSSISLLSIFQLDIEKLVALHESHPPDYKLRKII